VWICAALSSVQFCGFCVIGFQSVTLQDPQLCTYQDLGTQFFLRLQDVKESKNRFVMPSKLSVSRGLRVFAVDFLQVRLASVLNVFQAYIPLRRKEESLHWCHQETMVNIAPVCNKCLILN